MCGCVGWQRQFMSMLEEKFFPGSLLMVVVGAGGRRQLIVCVQRRTCISVTQRNVTSSTEQSPSWETSSSSASQEITVISRNLKVHYCVHNTRHLSLSWARSIQSINSHLISLRTIVVLSLHLHLACVLFLVSPRKACVFPLSPIRATCPAYLILVSPNLI
jgi:hypothetical protein